MATLKSVIEKIQEIVSTNAIYKTFGNGDLWEIDSKTLNYPVIWVNDQTSPHSINKSSIDLKLDILFFDKVYSDESNELQIKSDTLESAIDFVNFLKNNFNELDFYIKEGNSSVINFTEKWNDKVSGCVLSIIITLKGAGSTCSNMYSL